MINIRKSNFCTCKVLEFSYFLHLEVPGNMLRCTYECMCVCAVYCRNAHNHCAL